MSEIAEQSTAEQLRQSRARLLDLSQQTQNWMWETDENHVFTYFSQTLEQFSGIKPSDLIGTSRLDAALNSEDEAWHQHAKNLQRYLPFKDFRYDRLTASGETRHIITTGWPMFDNSGIFTGFRGIARDETEAVAAQRKQQAKEAHFASEIKRHRSDLTVVLDNLRQAVMWFDAEGYIRLNNPQTATLLGFDPDEYARVVTIHDHLRLMAKRGDFGEVDIEEEVATRANRLCKEVTEKTSYRIRLVNSDRFLQVDIRPLQDGSRILTHSDVTEEARAENAARDRQRVLFQLVDNIDYGTIILDAKQCVDHANRMYCELTGLDADYLAQQPHFRDVLDKMHQNQATGFLGEDEKDWCKYREEVLLNIQRSNIPAAERVRQDGKTIMHGCIDLPQGKRLLTYLDVSEHKQRQKRLEEMSRDLANANEMLEERVEERTRQLRKTQSALVQKERQALLGDLVGRLCHELRNPLNALNTSMFIVRRKVEADRPELTSAFDRSSRTIDRCKNILDDLYVYSLSTDFKPQQLDVQPWLETFVSNLEAPKEVSLSLQISEKLPEIGADRVQLGMALRKITNNAIQACKESSTSEGKGAVTISTNLLPGCIELSVSDTGTGMDEETKNKACEPLFSTRGFGVGLGLPIVRQVVDRHNGMMSIDSKKGEGTTVTIKLPLDTPDQSQAA